MKTLHADTPDCNFVAFYSDGSGAGVFHYYNGVIMDAEGDSLGKAEAATEYLIEAGYCIWMPLPKDFDFWFMQKEKD